MAQAKGAQPGLLCGYCGRSFARRELTPAEVVRPQLAQHLDQSRPDWRRTGFICRDDLTNARQAYVEEMIVKDRGEVTELDKSVIESISRHETLSSDFYSDYEDNLSFGERLSDRVSEFGGSWPFIITFAVVLVAWMAFNSFMLFIAERFDPYPYILLNLVLSCLAAVQAPVIIMSQRRQEAKDRLRAENDYRVNLKAELEVRHLHEKLDHLLVRQWERLAEIQQVQLELMEDLGRGRRR